MLREPTFLILTSLAGGSRHGYGIIQDIAELSGGRVRLRAGTLYGSLGRMMTAGLIRETEKRVDPAMDDERRIYYTLTGLGRRALSAELDRYREVVAVATEKHLEPNAFADAV